MIMKKITSLVMLAGLVSATSCLPIVDLNGPGGPTVLDGNQPLSVNESVVSMRNLPYAGGSFSEVFHPAGIKAYVEAAKAGETLPAIFPEDGGCSYGLLNELADGSYQLEYHLCATNMPYSNTVVNGHLGGSYLERPDGSYQMSVNFDCLGTDDWTLFGSEQITGKWEANDPVARYTVEYRVDISDYQNGYIQFSGSDTQTFDGELFTVSEARYTLSSDSRSRNSSLEVSEPLVFKQGCVEDVGKLNLFAAGIESETLGSKVTEINYGDGTCDDDAQISANDEVRDVCYSEEFSR